MTTAYKAVIIGAGVAGLASAIRLSVQGFDVTVYEKNSYPGGKLSHFTLDGFSFDAGPSLFTQPENIIELFELAHEPVDKYFQFEKVPVTCKYFFENGMVVNAYAELEKFAAEMQEKTGEDGTKILSYLKQSENVYNSIGKVFLDHSIHKRKSLLKAPLLQAIKAIKSNLIFGSLNQLNTDFFTKP